MSIDIPDSRVFGVLPEVRTRIEKVLDGRLPSIKIEGTCMTIGFLAESKVPAEATTESESLVPELTNILGRDPQAAFSIWVAAPEAAMPSRHPGSDAQDLPACVGVGEAAQLLGVTKQRVHQLTRSPGFPEPVMRLKATPVWLRDDVLRFQEGRNLRPGPLALG